jgi:penicillin-binding protein 1A
VIKKIFVFIFLFSSFFLGLFFYLFEYDWVDCSSIQNFSSNKPSIVFDKNGKEFFRFELDRREPISYEKLPEVLIKAFIAAEDHDFFNHNGISFKGIIRSTLTNIYRGKIVGGASTITQQLARGLFLSREQKILRKIKEIFLAFQLERRFSKKQIFELYVNNVYFGRGIYGVEAACQRFWDKSVAKISLEEAATLAAVAKSARWYSPLNDLEKSAWRRNIILRSMMRLKFISKEEFETCKKKEMNIKNYVRGDSIRLYIQERIRLWAEKKWGRDALYKSGLKIKTTVDRDKQSLAEFLFVEKIKILRTKVGEQVNGGMISIEPQTGKIRVCIGGYDFKESQFNRAFQAVRQMGSSFKPIVYTAAMQAGIGMDTVMVDEPIRMTIPGCEKIWKPKNWTRRFDGSMTLAKAISFSNNIITIKTLLKTGMEKVIGLAKKFGLNRSLKMYPSLALGITEATVEESVAAFNVFANNGFYVEPYLVEWVKNSFGRKIWEHHVVKRKVLDTKTNSKMVNLLSLRMQKLKENFGKKSWIDADVIGKTGSTNGACTTWYVGATPELTTSIYVGRDDNKPMGEYVFGSQTAYPVWLDFYKKLSFNKKHFYIDPRLREICLDWVTGNQTYDSRGKNRVKLLV